MLAGGRTQVGVESTVVDVTGEPCILRPGGVTREQLEMVLSRAVALHRATEDNAPSSPGMLASHYAPDLPLRLNAAHAHEGEAFLAFGPNFMRAARTEEGCLNLSSTGDMSEAAANLFAMLRDLDRPGYNAIAVAPIPETGLGLAINDRLRRAAAPR
jgi:L-threonylcarbamoyladenylate synthase